MKLQSPRGTRDYLPDEKILRDDLVAKLKVIFEKFGYNPLETPGIELLDILSSKYAGGEEIMKETYKLKDQGDRDLCLRYDLTVPFARVIAMNPNIKKPFKRYQMGKVWRDGPVKLGRLREFWQCDVDVVGTKSLLADAELLAIASEFYKSIGLDVDLVVNNRKLMDSFLKYAGIPDELLSTSILTIDKLKKIGAGGVIDELVSKGVNRDVSERVIELFKINEKSNVDILNELDNLLEDSDGLNEMQELLNYCQSLGLENVKLDLSLARGLAYYTGMMYEAFVSDGSFASSIGSGGRYDEMIGKFVGNVEIPAVGISFGLDAMIEALRIKGGLPVRKSVVQVYVVPIKTTKKSLKIVNQLRKEGVNVDIDLNERSISKNLDYANAYSIPFVLFVGQKELENSVVKLKDMKTGEEKELKIDEVANLLI